MRKGRRLPVPLLALLLAVLALCAAGAEEAEDISGKCRFAVGDTAK